MSHWTTGQLFMFIVFCVAILVILANGAYRWHRSERMRKDPTYGTRRGRHRIDVVERGTEDRPYVVTNVRHTPRHRER